METLNACPLCSGTKFIPLLSCRDYTVSRETFNIVRCAGCGFRFTNPRPDENEASKYYESEEYVSHSGTSKGTINKIYKIVRNYTVWKKVRLVNKQITKHGPQSRNILDIGTGTGEFLNACQQNGWNATGVEPSESARKYGKQRFGIDILNLQMFFQITETKFNVITMWHVLEHVYQLHKTISHIKNILVENGTLIIAVPNCNSWDAEKYGEFWAAYDLPRHIYHFTKTDIEKLFSQFEFTINKVLPMKLDAYYISLLSEKYKTGKSNLIAGFLNGLKSNLLSGNNNRGYSSQIYIIKNK